MTIVEALPHLVPLEDEAQLQAARAGVPPARHHSSSSAPGSTGVEHHRHAASRVTLEGGETLEAELLLVAVGRGPGLGRPRLRGGRASRMDRGFVKVDEYCQTNVADVYAVGDLHPDPAAGPRRLRRGHPGRRADRRAAGRADRLRRRPARSPTPSPRSPRSGSPRPQAARSAAPTRSRRVTYDLAGNGKSADPQHRGRGQAGRRRRTARCSACTWSATASAS